MSQPVDKPGTDDKPWRSHCPFNIALEIFGDRWTLLIVRDLMFRRRKRYGEFLDGPEGIATNILAARLKALEANGLIERRRDPEDARKWIYRLTEKGMDLAPAMAEIMLWAAKYETVMAPPGALEWLRRDRDGALAEVRRWWTEGG